MLTPEIPMIDPDDLEIGSLSNGDANYHGASFYCGILSEPMGGAFTPEIRTAIYTTNTIE